jgi:hypothetical protein
VTLYIVNPDLQKQLQRVDRKGADGGVQMQRFAVEGGKWVDGIQEY